MEYDDGVKQHSMALMLAFRPVRIFLLVIGQMPFVERKRKNHTVTYKFTLKGFVTPLFACVYTLASINFILMTLGILSYLLPALNPHKNFNATKTVEYLSPKFVRGKSNNETIEIDGYQLENKLWEDIYIQRHFIPIIVVWSWMCSAVVGSTYVITHGHAYTHFFNYMHKVVQLMDMDVTTGIKRFLWVENIIFGIIVSALFGTYIFGVYNTQYTVVVDICSVMANFVLRNFNVTIPTYKPDDPTEEWKPEWKLANLYGLFIIIFAYAGSRTNIVQFVFFCRVLTNACAIFNERLLTLLQNKDAGENEVQAYDHEQTIQEKRKVHGHVFRDHLIIVQLFRMTESLFAPILLPYFLFQVTVIVLQLYNMFSLRKVSRFEAEAYSSATNESKIYDRKSYKDKENQEWDQAIQSCVLSLVFIAQAWIFMSSTTRSAATAAENAMAAFKIVRRNGYITCYTKRERNLMHSLIFSFAKNNPIRITAGSYFAIDKALLPAIIGTILNYIVAVYTLKPDVWEESKGVTVHNTSVG